MGSMINNRLLYVGALVALVVAWVVWQIWAGWGLVTLDVRDAPLAKVLSSISRQGGIEVVSSVDPTTPVTIKVKRVPPQEALDVVAVRTDTSWRLAYLGAPNDKTIDAALVSFRAGREAPGWTAHGADGMLTVQPQSGAALDLRRVQWSPAGTGGELPVLLQEAAQKTGVLLAAPSDWKTPATPPPPGPIASAAPRLFRNAGGTSREVFLLRGRPQRDDDEMGGGRGGPWIGSAPAPSPGQPDQGRMRSMGDPRQMEERVEAQIALLPPSEQEKAREDFRQMRDFWRQMRDLPEDQRRAKAQEFFNRPDVAERMDERRMAREAKMTPEQRIARAQRYLERKAAMKKSGQQP